MLLIAVLPLRAAESPAEEESIDVKSIIFDHLKDSYHWHILSTNNKEISLYLPVILHSKVSGWHFFMSSKLGHEGSYDGFRIATEGAYKGRLMEVMPDGTELKPLDLSLTKVALGIIFNCLLLCVIVMSTARWYRRHDCKDPAPGGFTGLMELVIYMVMDDIIKPSV